MSKKKALVATGNSMLTIVHALLSDPEASDTDLGPDYYEQRMHARRQARNHLRSLERLGYKVTIEAALLPMARRIDCDPAVLATSAPAGLRSKTSRTRTSAQNLTDLCGHART